MKKITSFLMMMVLCCVGAFAQATEYADKIIKIGAQQTDVESGKWYFLHTPRNMNQSVTSSDYADSNDGVIQSKGGLVYDNTSNVSVSRTTVIDELTAEEGVSSNDYLKMMAAPLHRILQKKGVESVLKIYGTKAQKDIGHVFHLNCRSALADQCNDEQCAFFRAHLR